MTLVNHIGLTVSDLDASVGFYSDFLGFEVLRRTPCTAASWFRTLTENPEATVVSATLYLDALHLQLVHYNEGGRPPHGADHAEVPSMHLCLNVRDLAHWRRQAQELGHHLSPVVDIDGTGNLSCYVHDPDGVPVELLEPVTGGRWP